MRFIFSCLFTLAMVSSFAQEQREFEVKEGDTTFVMKRYYMCFLYKGENRTHDSTETAKIQAAHLARINELASQDLIHLAGPFGHNGDLRGIFIYDVGTEEEAKKLAESDPAVKAGRLRYEVFPWWGAKGTTLH